MRHTVKLHGVIIGHSNLEEVEPLLGRAWGEFHPGFGYELVQPIFRLFAEAVPMPGGEARDKEKLERYLAARDKLGLELVDPNDQTIPTSAIHIADYSEEKGSMALDVLVMDDEYWKKRVKDGEQ